MTTTREIKHCTTCGERFESSRTGKTVRCMACREAARPKATTRMGMYEEKAVEAKTVAYAARREHGIESAEYKTALAEYLHWHGLMERAI